MSSQRERQEKRERERSQRQLTGPSGQSSSHNSLFGDPIRKSNEDETTKRIKSTLGDFDSVQRLLITDPKPLLGISTREITRIKGHKAKIEQILSEMKHTLEPITALDDYADDPIGQKYLSNSFPNANNNSQHFGSNNTTNNINNNNNNNNNNCKEDIQRSIQTIDRNNRKSIVDDNDLNDTNSDGMSGRSIDEQKTFANNSKVINCSNNKKRKSSKSDAENNGSKSTKRTKSTSSSENSSDSSSNSSSISTSSSESSDEDEEDKALNKESAKHEDIPSPPRQETPKTVPTGNAPDIGSGIDVWDLETFMDKKTTTTTTTSTTVSTNSTYKTIGSVDSMVDVIDQVAKGELGESMSSASSSSGSLSPPTPPPLPTKRSKWSSETPDWDEPYKHKDQNLSSIPSKQSSTNTTSKHLQQNKSTSQMITTCDKSPIKRLKDDKYDKSSDILYPPKSLMVSIQLLLLKRIPGQTYSDSSASSIGDHLSLNSDLDVIDAKNAKEDIISNNNNSNNNNNSYSKSKNMDKINKKLSNDSPKKEPTNRKDMKSKSSSSGGSGSAKVKSSKQSSPIQDNDSHSSEHTSRDWSTTPPMRDINTSSFNHNIKQETNSPPQLMPPLTNSSLLPIPPPPLTTAPPTTAHSTPPITTRPTIEISPNVGQPDDFLMSAKRLKHAADRENDRTVQACKYLEAVLYFILTGNAMEQRTATNEAEKVFLMYKETLNLIRTITNKFSKSRSPHSADVPTTDHKLTTLSYRCQSLLYLKLSRIKSKEIRDNNKTIQSQTQDINNTETSVSIPTSLLTALQRQMFLLQQYHTAHDLWSQADHLIEKHPSCKAFFVALDNECGSLSLNSTFDHLVHYVRTGLQILK